MRAGRKPLVAALLAIGALAGPRLAAGAEGPEVLPLHVFGTAASEPTAPGHVAYTVGVFSITTGERLGSLHDEITCSTSAPPPCLVFDVATTLTLRNGVIENHAQWSGAPDPQRPGFLLVGTRPGAAAAHGTGGAFAGRAAQWDGSGTVDTRRFPSEFGYDIFSVVTFR